MDLWGSQSKNISFFVIFFVLLVTARTQAANEGDGERLSKIISPYIRNETLFIEGRIDSHIYNYLMYDADKVKSVKYVVLNSYGGNSEWALNIARKLKELSLTTQLPQGNVCASACVYLFAAGKNRQAAGGTWFGIHGARLGVGYTTTFQGVCFVDFEDGTAQFTPKKRGCQEFLRRWFELTSNFTREAFEFMESAGVSAELKNKYMSMQDDEDWPEKLNVLRKPDWILSSGEAFKFNLVTEET